MNVSAKCLYTFCTDCLIPVQAKTARMVSTNKFLTLVIIFDDSKLYYSELRSMWNSGKHTELLDLYGSTTVERLVGLEFSPLRLSLSAACFE